ncbi:DUF6526 family protein [Alkalihalobacillus hemicellulosilyticus]|uniref:Uncharacterized protein n=1 Tax=Halalkalibacter hemicellulosilyticusJCM 9152 TaxID=1236971 RepID=W4QCG1_9BACI|nr:DUF6526 family protein [Halalkalibacter hemicellulosilyticus]GAE29642.1 hypothetical protein JCM9152_1011 [Halalkalibacter hemicellulosilyticusJCM 9152]
MKSQSFKNHTRSVPLFHYFLVPLCFITFIFAVSNAIFDALRGESLFTSILLISIALIVTITVFFLRSFVCKVQDRAIRAEESLRHFTLTGTLPDPRLSIKQIVALRFASDEEFPSLCNKAIQKNMSPNEIKQSIQSWKADHDRV